MERDLVEFCDAGNVDMVKLLLQAGVNPSSCFFNGTLYWATFSGHYKVVKLLESYMKEAS